MASMPCLQPTVLREHLHDGMRALRSGVTHQVMMQIHKAAAQALTILII
jgi:hypothetical protein